jgi:hypothetical protein
MKQLGVGSAVHGGGEASKVGYSFYVPDNDARIHPHIQALGLHIESIANAC